ncbi:MAG: hypothetical protein H6Q30_808 [Bacteroidetes bacterium]|nr:hypothetical protein [Bacteroidota bacterium]
MAKGDDIRNLLVDFTVEIMDLCDALRKKPGMGPIPDQLMRCGTSPGPNYAEARGAESARDFVHKLGITLKELNESEHWLEVLIKRKMAEDQPVEKTLEDCKKVCRIIGASVRTAKKNLGRYPMAKPGEEKPPPIPDG